MTIEQNKAIVHRFFKAFEANRQAAFSELLAPDLVAHLLARRPSRRCCTGLACSMRLGGSSPDRSESEEVVI
jgi:hypothetical protein